MKFQRKIKWTLKLISEDFLIIRHNDTQFTTLQGSTVSISLKAMNVRAAYKINLQYKGI